MATIPLKINRDVWALAQARWNYVRSHSDQLGHMYYTDPVLGEYLGLMGEMQFAIEFQLPWFPKNERKGDGGVDFWTAAGESINVKTAAWPVLCYSMVNNPCAIYVLAHCDQWSTITLMGWEFWPVVAEAPVRWRRGAKKLCQHLYASQLRPMSELRVR